MGSDVQFASKSGEGSSIDGMSVGCAEDVRPGFVNSRVDCEGSGIQEPTRAGFVQNVALVIHEQQVRGLNERKMESLFEENAEFKSSNQTAKDPQMD